MNEFHSSRPMRPIQPGQAPGVAPKKGAKDTKTKNSDFSQVLEQKLKTVNFSKHAENRIRSRNIDLSPDRMEQLNSAIDKAEAKGSRESLVVIDQTAFVVSVKNRTVITAADEAQLKENVFTNIDSAVIM